jgi:Holliday junction resolvase RusA-like endonuclease
MASNTKTTYYRFIIEGRPASKKNNRRNFGRTSLPSLAYMRYREEALPQIITQFNDKKIFMPVRINITFYQKGRLRQDIDNALSSVLDLLQEGGVIADDNLVTEVTAKKISGKQYWSTEITLREV